MESDFEDTVDRCQRKIYSYACYLLRDRGEAEDVIQEAFVRLWKHWETVDPARVESWLARVTRNLCYDRLRVRKRASLSLVSALDGEIESARDQAPGPKERAAAAELRDQLQAALDLLKEPMKSVLVLREILGYKYQEISETLDIPLNTVRVYLHRGRKRLRDELSEAYAHDG